MAKKEVLINVTVNANDGIKNVGSFTKSLSEATQAGVGVGEAVETSMAKAAKATTESAAQISKATGEVAKNLGSVNSAAGIAGATVNEFGRFVSDLPFGIVAVTNNLSQMGSLFAILVGQASQMNNKLSTSTNVFNLLKAQFLGPAGVLFLFQAAVAGLTLYAQRSKEASKATESIAAAVGSAATSLKVSIDALNSENVSYEEKLDLIEQINREYPKLNAQLDENNKLTDDSTAALNAQVSALEKAAKARAILNLIDKEFENVAKAQSKSARESAGALEYFSGVIVALAQGQITSAGQLIDAFGEKVKENAVDAGNEAILAYRQILEGEGLLDYVFKGGGKDTDMDKKAKMYTSQLLGLISTEIKALEEGGGTIGDEESIEENERRKLDKLRDLRLEQLAIEEEAAIAEAELAGFKNEELDLLRKDFQLQEMMIISQHNKAVIESYKDFNKTLELEAKSGTDVIVDETVISFKDMRDQIIGTYSQTETAWREHHIKISQTLREALEERRKIEENGASISEEQRVQNLEKQMMAIQAAQELANGIFDIANAQFDKEMTLEQNKTVEINNQLKERLRNEQLSADERKSIQNQIAQNDEALRKKQEAIEEKRFKLNKAASLANAVVNTYLAATGVLADTKGGTFARIAGMIAVIGAGLAQVAVIAKQRFVKSDAGGAPGISASSATAPTSVQAPAFNVVGQSSVSQLADVVRGQLDRPVKTYVVASEVTTAQALERNRVSAASI
jgi:hypothetical protein